jgi:DNA-directed RNA polymerase III subunit RPC6
MASKAEIAALKEEVYEACVPIAQDNPRIVLRQADILDLDIIPNGNLQTLLDVAQSLLNEKLFKVVHDTDGMGWKLRTVDEAKKYVSPQLHTLRGRMRAKFFLCLADTAPCP